MGVVIMSLLPFVFDIDPFLAYLYR